jgi:hypothetical protein
MSLSKRRWVIAVGVVATFVVGAGFLLPAFAPASNCGGNSAALDLCKEAYFCFQLAADTREDGQVSIADLSLADRENFKEGAVAGQRWIGESKILVTRRKVVIGEGAPKTIVAVCDTPFDNVPRRTFGKAPPTHAVAYADGTTGLLPIGEFRRLDLSGFVDVRTIAGETVEPEDPASGRR